MSRHSITRSLQAHFLFGFFVEGTLAPVALTGANLVTDLDAALFFPAKVILLSLLFLTSLADFFSVFVSGLSLDLDTERALSAVLDNANADFLTGTAVFFLSRPDVVLAGFVEDLSDDFRPFGADYDLDFCLIFVSFAVFLLTADLAAPLSPLFFCFISGFLTAFLPISFGADTDLLAFEEVFNY